jgi:hypothetical protein
LYRQIQEQAVIQEKKEEKDSHVQRLAQIGLQLTAAEQFSI